MKIKNIEIKGCLSLAPMAGVTDRAFREICEDFGASLFTSEMVSTKGLIYNSEKTKELLTKGTIKSPYAIQLFGNEPEDFAKAAEILKPFEFDIIDVNMGCPVPKVTKVNAGSALSKTPDICGKIVEALRKSSEKPVTVKIRSGWDASSINAAKIAKICENAGADAITIHGRTKAQMYSGNVNLDVIKEVKNAVKIPVIGNGDINSAEFAKKMLDFTNCDMLAIGRGSFGNPFIFSEINSKLWPENSKFQKNIDRKATLKCHVQKLCEYKGEFKGIREAKKHIAWYIKGVSNASELRKKSCFLETYKDFELFLTEY